MFKLNGKSATVQISRLWALGHSRSLVFSAWRGGSGIFNYTLNTSKEKIHFGSPVYSALMIPQRALLMLYDFSFLIP